MDNVRGDKHIAVKSDGWKTSYYDLPPTATQIQDLIEFKEMDFSRANIFKAAWRLGGKDGTTVKYDLNKIIWFAQRLLALEDAKDAGDLLGFRRPHSVNPIPYVHPKGTEPQAPDLEGDVNPYPTNKYGRPKWRS